MVCRQIKREMSSECMLWRGCEGGGYIEDDGSITLWAAPEEKRIKKSLSEGEKVLSCLVKLLRESFFLFK